MDILGERWCSMPCVVTPLILLVARSSYAATRRPGGCRIAALHVRDLAACDLFQVVPEVGDGGLFDELTGAIGLPARYRPLQIRPWGSRRFSRRIPRVQSLMARMMVARLSSSPNPSWQYRSTRRWPMNFAPAVDSSIHLELLRMTEVFVHQSRALGSNRNQHFEVTVRAGQRLQFLPALQPPSPGAPFQPWLGTPCGFRSRN